MVKKVAGKLTKKDKFGQGYGDWAAESLGMRHRKEKTKGKMTLADRVRMMKGMDKALKARAYKAVGTMDRRRAPAPQKHKGRKVGAMHKAEYANRRVAHHTAAGRCKQPCGKGASGCKCK
jgi:hypothetical protein